MSCFSEFNVLCEITALIHDAHNKKIRPYDVSDFNLKFAVKYNYNF